jgi:PAS domain S-box-containing protein
MRVESRLRAAAAHGSERFAHAILGGPLAICVVTIDDQRVVEINDSFLLLTGHERADVIGRTIHDIHFWVDMVEGARLHRAIRRGCQVRGRELRYRTRTGAARFALVCGEGVAVDGEHLAIVTVLDITDRKHAEEQAVLQARLQRNNTLLQALNRAQSEHIAELDAGSLFEGLLAQLVLLTESRFGFIGEVLADTGGAPYLKTLALTDTSIDEPSRALMEKHRRAGLEYGDMNTLYGEVLTHRVPVCENDAAGGRLGSGGIPPGHPPLESFFGVPLFGASRELVGVLALANRPGGYDSPLWTELEPLLPVCGSLIEARRSRHLKSLAESARRESERQFRLLVDSVRDYALVMLDPFGRVASWNAGAERSFGYPADEVLGLHVSELYPREERDSRAPERDLQIAAGEGRLESEGWRLRRDNSRFWANTVLTPVHEEQHLCGFALVTRDITERRDLARMKDEFVSMVSHELRTPLTAIRGALGLIEGGAFGALPKVVIELVSIARSNSERLVRLVNDILDMEKLEAGMLALGRGEIDANRLVATALDGLRGMAGPAGVALRGEVPASCILAGDEDRLVQVLTNLVSNAIKFSPPGSSVEVRVEEGPGRIRFSVVDQGPGIEPEDLSRLFGKFQQLDSTDARRRGGSGLGLAICKAIVEQHGGRVGVDSEPGHGSVFWFELVQETS